MASLWIAKRSSWWVVVDGIWSTVGGQGWKERDMGAAVSEMGIIALGMNETTWGDRSG